MNKLSRFCILAALLTAICQFTSSGSVLQGAIGSAGVNPDSSDAALYRVRQSDNSSRDASGKLLRISEAEHIRRANIYLANRLFDNAREHWLAMLEENPKDENTPAALFGIARSFFLAGRYTEAAPFFERLAREFPNIKEGRDGLSYFAASLLRSGKAAEAAGRYIEYTERYPTGERVESSYLNIIDAFREADRPADAIKWVEITRTRFKGTATETNALFARLRLDISTEDWQHAVLTVDQIRTFRSLPGILTSPDELAYLRAYSLERQGRTAEAVSLYKSIPDGASSYYGMLATRKLESIGGPSVATIVSARKARVRQQIFSVASQYPGPFRQTILQEASKRGIDPRFVLAIMRQESGFRPGIKSPAAARGLLQLTIDTAQRYSSHAGIRNLVDTDLYRPDISIAIGTVALADLQHAFPGSLEAVAASYNGGDDNVARWVKRTKQTDPGVFAAEVGFSESKDYVFKVLMNYRAYSELYSRDLRPAVGR
jgi:soluble lytic murein transglycosylase